jgi:putative FmdB family regulatory protein
MPLYEYKCHSCGKTFEVIQKFSDEPLQIHAGCGGPVEKLLSAPAFHLKGSGWYVTDYGKGGSKPTKSDDSKGGGKSEGGESAPSKSETKTESNASTTDSKSAATTESKPTKPSTAA